MRHVIKIIKIFCSQKWIFWCINPVLWDFWIRLRGDNLSSFQRDRVLLSSNCGLLMKPFKIHCQVECCILQGFLPYWCVSGNAFAFNTFLDGELMTSFMKVSRTHRAAAKSQTWENENRRWGSGGQTVGSRAPARCFWMAILFSWDSRNIIG